MIKNALYSKVKDYDFEKLFKKKGYAYFTNGAYNLNIIGVRAAGRNITNSFDDVLVLIYKSPSGQWQRQIYNITTDPGRYYMLNPTTRKGTAILVPGQYRGAYQIAYHKGKYKALCQRKPLPVYRDGNKDDKFDLNPLSIDKGIFGINIHKAGDNSTLVNGWSYGCCVLSKSVDFNALMRLAERSASIYGNSFTFTLINEEDL